MSHCPTCNAPLPPKARFCPSCGTSTAGAPAEERRIATVVFADVVGFTSLAEHLDPERTKRLIDATFERLVADIEEFGGEVDKVLGDAIIALFGAPVAHEDDAERAVRAALRMQESLAAYAREGGLGADAPIRMRIGINTGEVVVGTVAGADYTAMGDVVNTASRLQAAAPPGGVLVGEATYAATREAIRYELAGELAARGREQVITTWLAIEPLSRPGFRRRHDHAPFIGRTGELSVIGAALELSLSGEHPLLVSLSGDGGVGKTRLVEEMLDRVASLADTVVARGGGVPYGEANVWWPIASAFAGYLGLDLGAPADVAQARVLEQVTAMSGLPPEHAEVGFRTQALMHVFGYSSELDELDASRAHEAVFRTITALARHRLVKGPFVLSIDDVHWCEPVVLALLAHLLHVCARSPLVVITTARPDHDLEWPPRIDRATLLHVPIGPLSRADADALAEAIIGTDHDESVFARLYARSGGNPLFHEELAVMVGSGSGVIGDLPDSLRGIIAARLDQLPSAQRAVLDNAAVLGTSGSLALLETFAKSLGQRFDRLALDELADTGLLDSDGRRWRFRSDSVREVAYQTITKASRAQRHAAIAREMLQVARPPVEDLAHHLGTAAELVAEIGSVPGVPADVTDAAISWLTQASERSYELGLRRLGLRHSTRAIALLADAVADDPRRIRLLLLRAAGRIDMRRLAEARADVDEALSHVDGRDAAFEAEARRLLGSLHQLNGEVAEARAELGRAVELLRTVDEPLRLARVLQARGFIELFGGSLTDAEWFFGEAHALYDELDDARGLAWIEQNRAWLAFLSGDLRSAEVQLIHAAEALDAVGDRNGVGWARGLLGFVRFYDRRFDEAEALAKAVGDEAVERGDEWAAGLMEALLATLRLWTGRLEEAVDLAERARTRLRRVGEWFGTSQAVATLMRAQLALGRSSLARRSSEELLSLGESFGRGAFAHLAIAGAAMHRGDAERTLVRAEDAIARTPDGGAPPGEPRIIKAIALAQLGRVAEAQATLDALEGDLDHPFALTAMALVAIARGDAEAAAEHAAKVLDAVGGTYLDRLLAGLASAAAAAALGDIRLCRRRFADIVDIAMQTGDVISYALVARAAEHVIGVTVEGADPGAIGEGWKLFIDQLPRAAPAAA